MGKRKGFSFDGKYLLFPNRLLNVALEYPGFLELNGTEQKIFLDGLRSQESARIMKDRMTQMKLELEVS